MSDQLDRMEGKIDKLDDRLDRHDIHLAEYNEQLKYHIKRTELLETAVEGIMKHVHMVGGALKLLTSAGILLTIVKIFQAFGGI